jgi:hypothetical protein
MAVVSTGMGHLAGNANTDQFLYQRMLRVIMDKKLVNRLLSCGNYFRGFGNRGWSPFTVVVVVCDNIRFGDSPSAKNLQVLVG